MSFFSRMDLEIDAHSLEQALILRFFDGSQRQRKIVQLNGLNERNDTTSVARLVLDQCKPLIPPDRFSELERLIFYLQNRHFPGKDSLSDKKMRAKLEDLEVIIRVRTFADNFPVQSYIELLYEEGEPKQRGVALLAELVRHVEASQLAQIVENEQLMVALARIWREDSRKNFELAIHLAHFFHRLSQFAPFHSILSHLKIGLLSVQMVDFELSRWELWREQTREKEEKERRKWEYAMRKQDQLIAVVLRILLNLADDLRAEHKMLRKGLLPMLFKCLEHRSSSQLLSVAVKFLWKLSQFVENQQQIANSVGSIDRLVSLLAPSSNNAVAEGCVGVTLSPPFPSSDFLGPLLSLLFNCSFEPSSRRSMVNAGLVSLLASHISENCIALALMYQLSIVDDAKAMIAFTDCIQMLLHLLFSDSRLPSNGDGRTNEETTQRQKHSLLVKSLLVNIVLEKRNAQLLCGSEGQGLDSLMAFALENEEGDVMAMKIARNIASHEGPTRDMFTKWVPQLLENAIEKIHRPSVLTNDGNHKSRHIPTTMASIFALECIAICAQLPNANWTQLELIHNIVAFLARILGKARQNANDRTKLPTDSILDMRNGRAGKGLMEMEEERENGEKTGTTIDDEMLLQVIQLCGILAGHSPKMAEKVEMHLLPLVVLTLNKCQEDDEIVLQCVFVFLSLLAHGGELSKRICQKQQQENNDQQQKVQKGKNGGKSEREEQRLGGGGEQPTTAEAASVPLLLLNLMHDRNPQIRALCEQSLERVAEESAFWREQIREARFRWHNAQWLDMDETSTDALHRSAIVDHLMTMTISDDNAVNSRPFHMSNGEDELIADSGHVLNSEQLLNGTEF